MYIHQFSKVDRCWTVGYEDAGGTWHAVSDHETEEEAADRVAKLNGCGGVLSPDDIDHLAEALLARMPRMFQVESVGNEHLVEQLNEYKEMLTNLVNEWDAAGVMCVANQNQPATFRFIECMGKAKTLVRGS